MRKIVPFPDGGSTDVLARLMVSGSPYAFFNFPRDTVPVAGVMNRFHVMVVRHSSSSQDNAQVYRLRPRQSSLAAVAAA